MPSTNLALMKSIKLAFDPNQILNPGKVYNV
jgi:FAD/FMN-containing dehydrogenase